MTVIRFKNHGVDAIEVTDDGSGIAASDYNHIGQKHHTSKLSTFENLDDLETFGFRGEAISSLCALSDVHIVTATSAEAPRATRLELDHHGNLISQKVISAKVCRAKHG
jgi:DNA mismatch repair protein PMS2